LEFGGRKSGETVQIKLVGAYSVKETVHTGSPIACPRVIAFFGPDGAGKSTQAELLVSFLKARGFKVKKAWVRSTHTFAYILWMLFYKLNLCDDRSGFLEKMQKGFAVSYINESSYGAVSPITMSPPRLNSRFSKFIWSTIELIGIVPIVVVQVYVPLLLRHVVVAERFVVDSVASVAYFIGNEDFADGWQAKFLLSLIPKGTVFIYIDADYDTILQRRGSVAGPREYTEFHRHLYSKLSRRVRALRIDTSRDSVNIASQKIVNFISNSHE
jgi:thymidylate kinase